MLEYIRQSAQSFWVKVAFGVIILVFVFWGVGNFNDRDYSNVVAVVNGEPIVALQFEKAYQNAEEYILRNNPGMTREQLVKQHLGRQVLRDLIQQTLLAQEARRAGIEVTPHELRLAVGQMDAFKNDQGQFDPEAYKRVLAARRMSPAQYEKELADNLLREKIFALVTSPVWVDPAEARHRFQFLRERRIIDYLFVPAADFTGKVRLSEADIRAYYDANQGKFAIPPMADVAYIAISPADLVSREQIGEAAARKWYEDNKSRYERKESVRARHILVPLAPDAPEAEVKAAREKLGNARADIASGKSFAAVADALNQPGAAGKGGDLGWLARGEAVPEFEEVVFSLKPGQVSDFIRTPFGLHIAVVEEKAEAGFRPFDEVADEAYKALAMDAGADRIHEALDSLIEDNILQKDMAESAARYGLKAQNTGLVDRRGLAEKLGVSPENSDLLLATPAGSSLDTALDAGSGDSYIVARITRSEPAGVKDFASVQEEIRSILTGERAEAMAMEEARKILTAVQGETLETARKKYADIKEARPMDRGGGVPGFDPNAQLQQDVFAAPLQKWLPTPYSVVKSGGGAGAMLAYVNAALAPESGEFESVAEILQNAARQERMEGLYGIFMGQLLRNAKVELTNQALVDRSS